jgi:hypothetical protein
MSRGRGFAAAFVLAAVALMLVAPIIAESNSTPAGTRVVAGVPHGPERPVAALPSAAPSAASVASAPATRAAVGGQSCSQPTPQNPPHWSSLSFFDDVEVGFYIPGSPALDGGGFSTGLCTNNLPTDLSGFFMNVTTNVAMVNAVVTVWGTSWPNGTQAPAAITGFDPLSPVNFTANIPTVSRTTATFWFDLYRYFAPGSTVYFNMTIESAEATPSTIYSSSEGFGYEYNDSGLIDNFTWAFYVEPPWASTTFTSDIQVVTTPSVIPPGTVYDPNRNQSLQIFLDSISVINGTVQTIPKAFLTLREFTNDTSATYGELFSPLNTTVTNVTVPPAPGANGSFYITAYLPWKGGEIDKIVSPTFNFRWSTDGGWWYPSDGLVRNAEISTSPNVLAPTGTKTTLPAGTSVNVSIHEPTENVTFGKAQVRVHYSDSAGFSNAVLPMLAMGDNTSYALIPGLPAGGTVSFYIIVKDIFGTPIASGNWTYTESGVPQAGPGGFALAPGYGMFFFEAVDLTTGQLVPFLNFTLANASWAETRQGTALGFAGPAPLAGTGYLAVTYGTYVVTIHAFGQTQTATVTVSSTTPFDLIFYVASGSVAQTSWVQQTTITIPAVIGLVGAAVAVWPVSSWFRERRKKAEQEQRRITL